MAVVSNDSVNYGANSSVVGNEGIACPTQDDVNTCETVELSSIGKAMLEEVCRTSENPTDIRTDLEEWMSLTKRLQIKLEKSFEVHCFLMRSNEVDDSSTTELFTMFSSLFHNAFKDSNRRCSIAVQAMCDAFDFARTSYNALSTPIVPIPVVHDSQDNRLLDELRIPSWIPLTTQFAQVSYTERPVGLHYVQRRSNEIVSQN